MTTRVRVLLYATAPADSPDAVARVYHQISEALLGTPGLLRNELLSGVDKPDSFVVLSEWESEEAFFEWERGADHRQVTAPLRPYQDAGWRDAFGVYRVAGDYTAVG
ncbi:antibiotic biosynthesis monooxygenase [Winogradskya consettensis]|uniref:Antibiotic biosynthesis monooxygenase n=2 Tax=Winogradskya TaxID=3240235 RepID=A0A919VM53_9ACTN|nr:MULTISPECIES: antibiotic biosynthesis monooxygenase family protein [Actinoplanes]GIE24279.1 antibiotic biosynthesis monooxygenase [Actinoplanes humidus]GIM68497.1 antibiotic biosynthesis monooxygenase [Actinoplanes consettensis]